MFLLINITTTQGTGVVKELLEVDLKTIHAAMNLVKVNKENTMMSSDQGHARGRGPGEAYGPHPEGNA